MIRQSTLKTLAKAEQTTDITTPADLSKHTKETLKKIETFLKGKIGTVEGRTLIDQVYHGLIHGLTPGKSDTRKTPEATTGQFRTPQSPKPVRRTLATPGAAKGYAGTPEAYGTYVTPTTTIKPEEKKGKEEKKKVTKEKEQHAQYIRDLHSILSPYIAAAGQPAKQLKTMAAVTESPDYSYSEVDAMADQLAKQYSPNITAQNYATPAEQQVTKTLSSLLSPTSEFGQALSAVPQALETYEKAVPTKAIQTALLNRIKYFITYGEMPSEVTTMEKSWPNYLKKIYTEAVGAGTEVGGLNLGITAVEGAKPTTPTGTTKTVKQTTKNIKSPQTKGVTPTSTGGVRGTAG